MSADVTMTFVVYVLSVSSDSLTRFVLSVFGVMSKMCGFPASISAKSELVNEMLIISHFIAPTANPPVVEKELYSKPVSLFKILTFAPFCRS